MKIFKLVCVYIVTICLLLISGATFKGKMAKGVNDVPPECQHQNYCTVKPKDYPQEQFDRMFNGTKLGRVPNLVIEDSPDRWGLPGNSDECRTIVTYEPLYRVRSKRGDDWRLVINSRKQNYLQEVRLETCMNPEGSCFARLGNVPGITTYCKQNMKKWEFVVSDNKGGTETVSTDLPVCCSCHYKYVKKF